MLYILATVFLRMGHMVGYEKTESTYERHLLQGGTDMVSSDKVKLCMWRLKYTRDVWESLEQYLGPIWIDNIQLSVEAFLFYFEYLLQNEDVKYYKKNGTTLNQRLSSGRGSTCDTNASIVYHFQGGLSFGRLLQKFINGNGVCKLAQKDYPLATDGLFSIT